MKTRCNCVPRCIVEKLDGGRMHSIIAIIIIIIILIGITIVINVNIIIISINKNNNNLLRICSIAVKLDWRRSSDSDDTVYITLVVIVKVMILSPL